MLNASFVIETLKQMNLSDDWGLNPHFGVQGADYVVPMFVRGNVVGQYVAGTYDVWDNNLKIKERYQIVTGIYEEAITIFGSGEVRRYVGVPAGEEQEDGTTAFYNRVYIDADTSSVEGFDVAEFQTEEENE